MNIITKITTFAAFSFLVLGLPAIASAQYRDNGRNNDGRYDDGRYDNGRYDDGRNNNRRNNNRRIGNNANLRAVVSNLKSSSREFQRQLDRDLDRSRYDGTRREDQLNSLAKQFRKAVNKLKSGNSRQDPNRVSQVLDLGSQLDRRMVGISTRYNSRFSWQQVRRDLQILSNAYGYNDRGYGRQRNGNRRSGNGRGNAPSWWPF